MDIPEEVIENIRTQLPLPSEVELNCIDIPYMIIPPLDEVLHCILNGYILPLAKIFIIRFEKEYTDNICIGWKLKVIDENKEKT